MSITLTRPVTPGVHLTDLEQELGRADAAVDVLVTGVTLDSRTVRGGDLYAALPGFNVHGARFARDAVEAGAVAVLTDPEGARSLEGLAVPVVVVEDPRAVLGNVASRVYGDPAAALALVGITGTNGKTTTAYLVESALRAHGRRTGLIGTVETRIGDERVKSVRTTPEATDLHALLGIMRERGVEACVMEVSSHALELHRVDGVVYDVAVFTNLSQDHLDFHATMEDYFRAKASLFTSERARRGVVCVDDAWGRRLAAEAAIPVTTVGWDGAGAQWVVIPGEAQDFTLREEGPGGRVLRLVCHLPGDFNVTNTAMAALTLLALGLDPEEVERALEVTPQVPGRMEVIAPGGPGEPRCVVDFAHTPEAVDAALASLRTSTSGRLIAVVGAGGDRDRGKRPEMGAAAARRADVVIVTDDNPRSEDPATIRAAVLDGARREAASDDATVAHVLDGGPRARAIETAVALGREGDTTTTADHAVTDTVVVLGKGHETGQEINGVIHPFDDREAVRTALRAVSAPEDTEETS